MTYSLGAKSRAQLVGVDPRLVAVVDRAIAITGQDFSVHDGLRTEAQQRRLVASGASKTMKSKHLQQANGFGHAVDLVPYIGGQLRWEWPPIYKIATAMRIAAAECKVRLIWGGVWDRELALLNPTPEGMALAVAEYCKRHPGPDFIDGPHFELAGG